MLDRAPRYGDDGLYIRPVYRHLFESRKITKVVRPDDRSSPDHPLHIPPDIPLPVRYIKTPQPSVMDGPVDLFPDDGTTFIRTGCLVKRIGDLTAEDLAGTAPDTATAELVKYHVATLYNTPLPEDDALVTIWSFEIQPKIAR